jgi:hypothetical protein
MILKPVENKEDFFEKSAQFAGVFGSRDWLTVYGDQLSLVGIYKDEQQLIGGFFYLKVKKYGFSFLKLPPYTPHCGLFFISESKNKSSANSFAKEVMAEVCQYIDAQKAALTVMAFPFYILDLQPFIWAKYKVVPNYTYRIALDKPMEEIRANFDSKNRNAIAKAIKDGVEVRSNGMDAESLYNFFNGTLTAAGANIYNTELKHIFYRFRQNHNSFSMEAYKDQVLLGTVFCIHDQTTCYYLLGGVDKNSGVQGVNNLLVQYCIEEAAKRGCKVFDFEGSMLKGVEKFFRGFGPELVPYYTVNKAKLPIELMLKFKKRELF